MFKFQPKLKNKKIWVNDSIKVIGNKITRSFIIFIGVFIYQYLINISPHISPHIRGIIKNVEWTKTLYWRCNKFNLTSQINYTDSTDRRPFECSNLWSMLVIDSADLTEIIGCDWRIISIFQLTVEVSTKNHNTL